MSRSQSRIRASATRNSHRELAKSVAKSNKPGLRKRNTHRRSPEIIDAAARVFAARGYYGATTQDIADVLGIRQASLYYYFSSKEVALEIVCIRSAEGFLKAAQGIANGPGTPLEKLSSLIRSHISPLLSRNDYIKVFLTQRHFLPNPSRHRVGTWSRAIEKIFETTIRDGIRSGDLRRDLDPRLTMLAILGMANAVPSWYQKENLSIERITTEFIRFVLKGIAQVPDGRSPTRSHR
jgi:AcrR family transcriptional regulator